MAANQMVQKGDRSQAFQYLWQDEGESAVPEQFGENGLNPEGYGRLVYRYKTYRVKGNEKEVVPAHQHASHSCRVIGVAGAIFFQSP